MRIALLADPHITKSTDDDKAGYSARFARVITAVNAAKVDVVLIAGDLTQGGTDEEIADFKEMVSKVTAPAFWVPGNHDVGNKKTPGKDEMTNSARVNAYRAALGSYCQAATVAGVRIVTANASLFGSGLAEEAEQWSFLEYELRQATEQPTVLLQHYPLFIEDVNEPGGNYWALEPEPRTRLLQLLQRGGVTAVLAGHYHRPIAAFSAGIAFITAPALAFGLPQDTQSTGWTLVNISSDASNTGGVATNLRTVTAHFKTFLA